MVPVFLHVVIVSCLFVFSFYFLCLFDFALYEKKFKENFLCQSHFDDKLGTF